MQSLMPRVRLSRALFYLRVQTFPGFEIVWDFELPWFMTCIFDTFRKSFNYSLYSLTSQCDKCAVIYYFYKLTHTFSFGAFL